MSEAPQRTPRRGAPLRSSVHSRIRVEVKVTPAELQALKQMAVDNQRPMSTLIREAVNEFVADYGERQVFLTVGNRRS